MTITAKIAIGSLLSLWIFSFYSLYWVIFTPPDELVDCKIGKITAVVTYSDCNKLIKYAGSRQ